MAIETKKRKYDSNDSRRRLVRAGIDVFSKEGFDAATTRTIAKKAGVNEALIHRYFKNKLGLLLAAMTEFHQHIHSELPYDASQIVEQELKSYFRFRLDANRKERKFIKLALVRAILDKKVKDQIEMSIKSGTPALHERLEQLQADGKVSSGINLDTLCTVLGSFSFALSLVSGVVVELDPKYVDEMVDLVAKLVGRGLRP